MLRRRDGEMQIGPDSARNDRRSSRQVEPQLVVLDPGGARDPWFAIARPRPAARSISAMSRSARRAAPRSMTPYLARPRHRGHGRPMLASGSGAAGTAGLISIAGPAAISTANRGEDQQARDAVANSPDHRAPAMAPSLGCTSHDKRRGRGQGRSRGAPPARPGFVYPIGSDHRPPHQPVEQP